MYLTLNAVSMTPKWLCSHIDSWVCWFPLVEVYDVGISAGLLRLYLGQRRRCSVSSRSVGVQVSQFGYASVSMLSPGAERLFVLRWNRVAMSRQDCPLCRICIRLLGFESYKGFSALYHQYQLDCLDFVDVTFR